jgi:glycosyltransferase involved in cell wall biosynthesis
MENLSYGLNGDTIVTQKMNLSKEEYYKTLGSCSVIFSCSLHENLGISVMEAVLAGVIPVLPNRCSYSEMYMPEFLYPSEWTIDYDSYTKHKQELADFINHRLENREHYLPLIEQQTEILIEKYLTPTVMVNKLLEIK